MRNPALPLLGIIVHCMLTSCATEDAWIASKEVALFDSFVASTNPSSVFEKAEARANEPYILAGEDVAGLKLTILSLFKRLGDSGAERALRDASEQQRSAVRLFIQPEYLGSNFKKTRSLIERIRIDPNWPALKAEETAFASPVE